MTRSDLSTRKPLIMLYPWSFSYCIVFFCHFWLITLMFSLKFGTLSCNYFIWFLFGKCILFWKSHKQSCFMAFEKRKKKSCLMAFVGNKNIDYLHLSWSTNVCMEMHMDFTFYICLSHRQISTVISFWNTGMNHRWHFNDASVF